LGLLQDEGWSSWPNSGSWRAKRPSDERLEVASKRQTPRRWKKPMRMKRSPLHCPPRPP